MLRKEFARSIRNGHYELSGDGVYLPRQQLKLGGVFTHGVLRDGKLIGGEEDDSNIVVNQGLNHILDVAFHNQTQTATWYIGLFKGNYTPAATDTAANITANATEATEYDEATREEWIEAAAAAQAVTNSANRATFTMNATVTIYGAFLVSSSTKSGTAGVLSAASRFSSQRDLVDDDELLITYTLNAADA